MPVFEITSLLRFARDDTYMLAAATLAECTQGVAPFKSPSSLAAPSLQIRASAPDRPHFPSREREQVILP